MPLLSHSPVRPNTYRVTFPPDGTTVTDRGVIVTLSTADLVDLYESIGSAINAAAPAATPDPVARYHEAVQAIRAAEAAK